MPLDLPALVRDRLGVDLQEFAGASAVAEIPLTNTVIDRVLADRLANHPHIAAVRVEAHDGDWVAIHITPRSRLIPLMRATVHIEGQPLFPDAPTLLLQWSLPTAGPLAWLAGPILAYLDRLPPGVAISGQRAVVDIRELLRARGVEDVLAYVRALTIHTKAGAVVVRVETAI